MTEIEILRIDGGTRRSLKDRVADEVPFSITVDGREIVTLACSPYDLKELAFGFLFSSGLIGGSDVIESCLVDEEKWVCHLASRRTYADEELLFKRLYTSGCGRGVIFSNLFDLMHRKPMPIASTVSAASVLRLMSSFRREAATFRETGGVHSAALSDGEKFLAYKEDIGRHNAVDKVIGEAVLKGLKMEGLLVMTSGRVSSDIVFKIQKTRCPVLISRSAPTSQAIRAARELNLTLVGFVRGRRMNVYTGEGRIV